MPVARYRMFVRKTPQFSTQANDTHEPAAEPDPGNDQQRRCPTPVIGEPGCSWDKNGTGEALRGKESGKQSEDLYASRLEAAFRRHGSDDDRVDVSIRVVRGMMRQGQDTTMSIRSGPILTSLKLPDPAGGQLPADASAHKRLMPGGVRLGCRANDQLSLLNVYINVSLQVKLLNHGFRNPDAMGLADPRTTSIQYNVLRCFLNAW